MAQPGKANILLRVQLTIGGSMIKVLDKLTKL